MSEENEGFTFVRCCDTTKQNDMIYYFDDKDAPGFCYFADDVYIEYCPWCGILLDTNLLEDG